MRTSSSSSRKSPNRLLNSLSTADFGLLRPNLEPLALALRQVLETPNKRIDDVYFIASGFASVVAIQAKQVRAEVGLIGREGMTGLPIVLGDHLSPQSTFIQAAGSGQRIDAIVIAQSNEQQPVVTRGFIEIRAGLHGSDYSYRGRQRLRQARSTSGAVDFDG